LWHKICDYVGMQYVVHRKLISPYSIVLSKAQESVVAFQNAKSRKYSNKEVECRELTWQAPMDGFVKVNWDAIVDKNKKNMGVCVITKDCMGKMMATLSLVRTKRLHHYTGYCRSYDSISGSKF
jgi:hypothetical protein